MQLDAGELDFAMNWELKHCQQVINTDKQKGQQMPKINYWNIQNVSNIMLNEYSKHKNVKKILTRGFP